MPRLHHLENICSVITQTSLFLVLLIVPLIIVPFTSEVFEFNKIIVVYLLTTVIFFSESIRLLSQKQPTLKIPPFYLTGLLFLGSLVLTTATSIDTHVSLFGYYARFNGGLLSWVAYSIILLALIQQTPTFIASAVKASLLSGLIVAAWGVLEHWGIDASYWVQDVRYRVFSTIGQPNWLAAYLAMLIPFLLSFYATTKSRLLLATLFAATILFYTTFIFTYSRGGNLGLAAALLIWAILLGWKRIVELKVRLATLAVASATVTALFASSLTPIIFGAAPHRTVEDLQTGDQTAQTRLIVWQGSLDIFLHHPLVGTGPETFGESFYQYRPAEMNKISDFDFLFNKAHNEYINYLATTGLFGTAAYTALIAHFFYLGLKQLRKTRSVLLIAALSSVVGYLVQNIFGFTVVPTAILFILNLAVVAVSQPKDINLNVPVALRRLSVLFIIPAVVAVIWVINIWRSDVAYEKGISTGDAIQSLNNLELAFRLNPSEPLYQAELAYAYARATNLLPDTTTAKQDAALAKKYSDSSISTSPDERTLWRIRAQTFEQMIQLGPVYKQLALESLQKAISLAPTDPRVQLELGNFYESQDQTDLAISAWKSSLRLKPDFSETSIALANTYLDRGDKSSAKTYIDKLKQTDPKNDEIWILEQRLSQ